MKDQTSKCYLFLVILGDVAEELAGLPKQDVLLAKLFLQELLQHKKKKPLGSSFSQTITLLRGVSFILIRGARPVISY